MSVCACVSVCRVEDHDDLLPIFNQQTSVLKDNYGDYYLAELIEAQDADMKCLVAEVFTESFDSVYYKKISQIRCVGTVTVAEKH